MTQIFGNGPALGILQKAKDASISKEAKQAGLTENHIAKAEAKIRKLNTKAERSENEALTLSGDEKRWAKEDAQMFRADAKDMQRVLDLVLAGRFADAGHKLDSMDTDPRDEIGQILKGPIARGRKIFTPRAESYFY